MNEDDDIEAAQAAIRRGGAGYVIHVVGLVLGVAAFFGGGILGGWAVGLAGVFFVSSGAGAIVGRRGVLPAWWLAFLLSWVVEDRLTQERILAYVTGGMLILTGLLFLAQGLVFVALL